MPFELLLFSLLLSIATSALDCHYSCLNCTLPYYSHCTACPALPLQPLTALPPAGLCSTPNYDGPNPLGVLLLVAGVAGGGLLRSPHVMGFVVGLQSLGLLGLVETAMPYSLTTILNGLQYFMVFSPMQHAAKTSSEVFATHAMYRLQAFLVTPDLSENFTPLFALSIVAAVLVGVGVAMQAFRGARCEWAGEKALGRALVGLRCFLLLGAQEGLLAVYVGIRLDSLSGGEVAMVVLYSLAVVWALVDFNLRPLPFFRSQELMNLALLRRLLLPVCVILPHRFTFILVIFYASFVVLDLLLTTKTLAPRKTYLYLLLELACCITYGAFLGTELNSNSQSQAEVAAIFATLFLALYCAGFLLEITLALKNRLTSKVENEEWDLRVETTEKITSLREQETLPN